MRPKEMENGQSRLTRWPGVLEDHIMSSPKHVLIVGLQPRLIVAALGHDQHHSRVRTERKDLLQHPARRHRGCREEVAVGPSEIQASSQAMVVGCLRVDAAYLSPACSSARNRAAGALSGRSLGTRLP
jgi:isoaspartyl peptidase/L-asparaginase-like protein (Ntn-hydrolase superfamily)